MAIRDVAKQRKAALDTGYPKRTDVPQGKRPVGSQDAATIAARQQAEAAGGVTRPGLKRGK
jgi:hypothetical protein